MDWKLPAALAVGAAAGAATAYLVLRAHHPPPLARIKSAASGIPAAASSDQGWGAASGAALAANGDGPCALDLEDEIVAEQLTRNVQFFGLEAQQRICGAYVVVVGLGGVGSHAAHLLLRSGVGRLRLIDFDQVTLSSLNRHALAMRADVGTPKATCLAQHMADIMPEARVEAVVEMYTAEREEALLEGGGRPDYVLDAIDNIDTKVALVAACVRRGLPVLSVAGAGAKADPTRLKLLDVSESAVDPLARALRTRLRGDHGISGGVRVLLSTEKPRCKLVAMVDMEQGNPLDYQVVPNFRVRTIPVLGTTPALFGMAAAGDVLCALAGQPIEGEPIVGLLPNRPQYTRQLDRLLAREAARFGSEEGVAVDLEEVAYLVREVWRGFSARDATRVVAPGGDKGLMRATAHLALTRWDASRPATVDNLVLLTAQEADAHDVMQGGGRGGLAALRASEPEFVARVEAQLNRVRREMFF